MSSPKRSLVDTFTRRLAAFHASALPLQILSTHPCPTSTLPSRLLVLDSSFNPPTMAHAQMAREALRKHDRLMLLLSVANADKRVQPAGFASRLCLMDVLARKMAVDGAVVDLAVTTRPLFADKVAPVADSGVYEEVVFLVGFDTLVRILDVKYYDDADKRDVVLASFFRRARLLVFIRPSDVWGSADEQRRFVEESAWRSRVDVRFGDETEGVSSSRVRELVRMPGGAGRHEELARLVDEDILHWIESENLYCNHVQSSS
ncbi:hypothetical protein CDD80_4693 [Ophiocordyceps camponoti-rufipedis]|uniref:Cytidyltransferase-like domain-containing protein n=1 Tax=Ophiocordyceps camponoti-rufipedis TaxID=2004952 RepID=A0A2C5ZHI0_9HYPO|nr:hypothetical protein CDD80_4693 [Ophiocordyceps camponoti-rufipedis]